jgi:hypothetical protein
MSVTALSARAGRQSSHPSGSGRPGTVLRRSAAPSPPQAALTVTLAIPLTDEGITPQARRLLDALRELVELGQGMVTVAPPVEAAPADLTEAELASVHPVMELAGAPAWPAPTAEPTTAGDPRAAGATEVRLLTASRQVLLGGVPLPTTRLEFDLLNFLAENPRRVFTRMQLLTAVWGYEHTGERTVDVHVRRLRLKAGVNLPLITTVYGVGYRLADEARVVVVTNE